MIVCVCTGFYTGFVYYEGETIDHANHTALGGKGCNRKFFNFRLSEVPFDKDFECHLLVRFVALFLLSLYLYGCPCKCLRRFLVLNAFLFAS